MADILLVDDDTNIHQIASLFLENFGHRVTCVNSGEDGLDYAFHNDVELIILDLAMPIMDGVETFQKLRAHPRTRTVPVLVMSVHQEHELDNKITRDNLVSFISKPVDMDRLNTAVVSALTD